MGARDLELELVGARLELHVLELGLPRPEVVLVEVERTGDLDAVDAHLEDPVVRGVRERQNEGPMPRGRGLEAQLERVSRLHAIAPPEVAVAAPRPAPEQTM